MKNNSSIISNDVGYSVFIFKKFIEVTNQRANAGIGHQIVWRRGAVHQGDAGDCHRRGTGERQLPLGQQCARQTHTQKPGTAGDHDMTGPSSLSGLFQHGCLPSNGSVADKGACGDLSH